MFKFFGYGSKPVTQCSEPPKKTAVRALPASWYTSREFYEFERRAIFSKWWLFITHSSRLSNPGDFLKYEVAGYEFILVKDRSNDINAFHNVCRHRAYPFVERECGNTKIFACRYHGWSYGLDGRLAKAPDYDQLDGFDKSQNGLLPIHVHIDVNGFIYVNFDCSGPDSKPQIPWERYFADVDNQERFKQLNFDDYVLDHTYELEGEYNWKILTDNFNECYHCKTTHPSVPDFMTIDAHDVEVKDGHMQHDQAASAEQIEKGFNVYSTYYFPNTSMSISPHWMMIQKFLPSGPSTSKMHYEIFRNKRSSEEDFQVIAKMYAQTMSEDKVLCLGAQKNLNRGVIVNGELHPRWEKGPLFFQATVRDAVYEHYKAEQKAGHEIWPARQQLPENATISLEDEEICNGIICGSGPPKEGLVW